MLGLKEPIHPGEYLRDDHLAEFDPDGEMTESEKIAFFADKCGIDIGTFKKILDEEADVTASISKKLGDYFEKGDDYFLKFQEEYDSDMSELEMPKLSKTDILLMALCILKNRKYLGGRIIQRIMHSIDSGGRKYMGVPFFNFKVDDYGHFDQDVFDQLDNLCTDGFASKKENCEMCSDIDFNWYKLNKKGIVKGRQLLDEIPKFTRGSLESSVLWTYNFESNNEMKWSMITSLKDAIGRFFKSIGSKKLAYKKRSQESSGNPPEVAYS